MATSSSRRIFQLLLPIIRQSYCKRTICSSYASYLLKPTFGRPLTPSPVVFCSSITNGDTHQGKEQDEVASQQRDQAQISEMCDPYVEEVEPCLMCRANIPVSFKNVQLLSQFISPNTGQILDRKITRLCDFQQNRVEREIKTARAFGLMPYMYRETTFLKDPSLYSVRYTGNPNIGSRVALKSSTEDYEKTKPAESIAPMMAVKKKKQSMFRKGKLVAPKNKKK